MSRKFIRIIAVARQLLGRLLRSGPKSAYVCWSVHRLNHKALRATAKGTRSAHCLSCGWRGADFLALDCHDFLVPGVFCPNCGCQERHRYLDAFLTGNPPECMRAKGKILCFAADENVLKHIQARRDLSVVCTDYGDYDGHYLKRGSLPSVQSDMHNLPFRDNSFSGAFCLHVLEHVRDDVKCLGELLRVLGPGGQAVIMVPFMMGQETTIEYGAPDPELFDHVRGYSIKDFKDRLSQFSVREVFPSEIMTHDQQREYGVPDHQVIYICTKLQEECAG